MPACFQCRSIKLKVPVKDGDRWLTHVNVPCGKCENCTKRRRMEWCFRMEWELRHSKCAWFVTLTYKKVKFDKYGNMSLWPKHLTKFFKRLRMNELRKDYSYESLYNGLKKSDKLKYYACGEYGEEFGRPHYHAIIFNASRKMIEKSWKKGYVHIKKASPESIAYVTKYMDKWRNKKQDWKKQKEFNRSSEGLGKGFCEKMKYFYKENLDINYVVSNRGIKIPVPRYFRLQMLNEDELQQQRVIINNAIEKEMQDDIKRLGLDEYNRRRLGKINYIKKNFEKGSRKRSE